MVRRGQMTQDEADKLIREADDANGKRRPHPVPPPSKVPKPAPIVVTSPGATHAAASHVPADRTPRTSLARMGAARMGQYTCEQRTRGTSEEGGGH